MATFEKIDLSGSTDGRGIAVAAVATPGTLLHTAGAGVVNWDEIWLFAVNNAANTRTLTIEFGGVVDPGDHIEVLVPAQSGLYVVVPGLILQNTMIARAFADVANEVTIFGFVNRITA